MLRFPDFLCVGAQKSGTTWLHENIRHHPDIWLPPVKELQYFNQLHCPSHRRWTYQHRVAKVRRWLQYYTSNRPVDEWNMEQIRGITDIAREDVDDDWYGRVFCLAPPNAICGEITPEYSVLPRSGLSHIRRLVPKARIIFLMREPISRAWSHIRMLKKRDPSLDPLSAANSADVISRCDYGTIVQNWVRAYGADQVYLEYLDTIVSDPLRVLKEVCDHLELGFDERMFPRWRDVVFPGEDAPMPEDVRRLLMDKLGPIYEDIAKVLPNRPKNWPTV